MIRVETYKTPHAAPIVVDVDANGAGPDGERYDRPADPRAIVAGLAVARSVVLRGPDGALSMGMMVRATPAGIEAGLAEPAP